MKYICIIMLIMMTPSMNKYEKIVTYQLESIIAEPQYINYSELSHEDLYDILAVLCDYEDVDYLLFHNLIVAESDFTYNAVSHAGARGICQIMPDTWNECKRKFDLPEIVFDLCKEYKLYDSIEHDNPVFNMYNPVFNMYYGISYFKYVRSRTSNNWEALISYNAGLAWKVHKYTPPDESINYANKIYTAFYEGRLLLPGGGSESYIKFRRSNYYDQDGDN